MTEEEITEEIVRLSGSGKRVAPGARSHGIYSSFTIPPYDELVAVRDTAQRFRDFGLFEPDVLAGKTFLDVGSNVGAVSFHAAAKLGASVVGVEYREDRVQLCNVIAEKHHLDAKFYQVDLNELLASDREIGENAGRSWLEPKYDVIWCSSVDEYVDDVDGFYCFLKEMCSERLYFECNRQGGISVEETEIRLRRAGFKNVKFVGNGHSGGIARKRKLFTAEV